jgi:hypothetical protein
MRSPNYPQLSLPDAIEKVRTIYKAQHTAKADQQKVAELLGYRSLNGRSMGVLSALKKYGLLQGTGESLGVSYDAVIIIERQQGHHDRVEALRKLALTPQLFAELHSQFDGQIPADEDLRIYLASKGFSRTATNEITRNYRETMELVSSEAGEYTGGTALEITPKQEVLPLPSRSTDAHGFTDIRPRPPVYPIVEPEEDQELRFKISADSEARVIFRGEVTQQAIEKLMKLLDLSKDTFPSSGQPSQPTTQAIYDAIMEGTQAALDHLNMSDQKVQAILRSTSKSAEWTIDIDDLGIITIQVPPGDTVEEIKSKVMDKIVAHDYRG